MSISNSLFLIPLVLLVGILGCEQKKQPKLGAVEYPPSSPLPSLTALPGVSKRGSSPHGNYKVKGKESKWFVDGASPDDKPRIRQWIVSYYYYGPPKPVFKHVEECLSKGNHRYTVSKNPQERGSKNLYCWRDYEIRTSDGSDLYLYVKYAGHASAPYVEYLITENKRR